MSPDEPGEPGPPEKGATATFRPGTEPEASTPGPRPKGPPARRRLLDDPDPVAPRAARKPKVRARKVHRIVRHIEPWSVLKISVLFFLSIFIIICVASAILWNSARSAGAIDDVESFITSLGFGNCEDIDPGDSSQSPDTTVSTIAGAGDQVGVTTTGPETPVEEAPDETTNLPDEDGDCAEGQRLVGGFEFEDERIFQAFALGGVVLVLAGAAGSVVMALLFNLISDLTGGVRVTVLEEDTRRPPSKPSSGSPPRRPAD